MLVSGSFQKVIFSDGNHTFYMRVRLITDKFKVFKFKIENAFHVGIDLHFGQDRLTGAAVSPVQMVGIDVHIAKRVQNPWLQSGNLRHHQGQQGIGCKLKGTPKHRAALIELTGYFPVDHVN